MIELAHAFDVRATLAPVKEVGPVAVDLVLAALVKNATVTPDYEEYADGKGRRALQDILSLGYLPLEQEVRFLEGPFGGEYRDYFSGERLTVTADTELVIPPWGYRVLVH